MPDMSTRFGEKILWSEENVGERIERRENTSILNSEIIVFAVHTGTDRNCRKP